MPMCKQPDRDVPRTVCGYPLPCPYHTFVVNDGAVTVPSHGTPQQYARVAGVAAALRTDIDPIAAVRRRALKKLTAEERIALGIEK